jgi:hypothetical protein
VRYCADEAREWLCTLTPLWKRELDSPVAAVRKAAAGALADAAHAFEAALIEPELLPLVHAGLRRAAEQPADPPAPADACRAGGARSRPAIDSVGLGATAALEQAGLALPMPAPIIRAPDGAESARGAAFPAAAQVRQPWEAADGAVLLLHQLAPLLRERCDAFVPELLALAALTHFGRCYALHQTVWRAMRALAEQLGKRPFKRHLEELVPLLFTAMRGPNALAADAAAELASWLSDWLGPTIFAARLTAAQKEDLARSGGAGGRMGVGGGEFGRVSGGMLPQPLLRDLPRPPPNMSPGMSHLSPKPQISSTQLRSSAAP